MGKIEEAKIILQAFGLPDKQQNDRSARTLCALADVKEKTSWSSAKIRPIRIHDILEFISTYYGFTYAENSRETIRRQTIHQFEQARIVDRNIDDPKRPTNSGKTVYSLSKEALKVIRSFGTAKFKRETEKFIADHGRLREEYDKKHKAHTVPINIMGRKLSLSPGKHNVLQKDIIEQFVPRFANDTILLYIGDTANKHVHVDVKELTKLKIPVTKHDKLPDIVLYDRVKNWLFLIEAITTHGPVSPKRHFEIEKMLTRCPANKIYVSAFPDFGTYVKYAREIAWETEVWISDNPAHMIHYNGDKFLGPFK